MVAHVHPTATITPTKAEVVRLFLERADWFDGDPSTVEVPRRLSYRFDDPAGEVGIEVLVARDGDRWLQVPLTYRDAPLAGADEWLLTTMEHSVLGRRWIQHGIGDPVLVAALVRAIAGRESSVAMEYVGPDGERGTASTHVTARGTGAPVDGDVGLVDVAQDGDTARVTTSAGTLVVPHVLGREPAEDGGTLLGSWDGADGDVLLARLEP
ncbi:MAG: hypothetical protein PGN07_11835 [Aeromicrobium erythreum]